MVLFGLRSAARADDLSVEALKQLTLQQLLNVNVTSVSRHPERWLDAASAIQVVTSAEIEQSAASSLPEALRLAPNLDVAQKNPHDWGISARGFNAALANKLLVMIDGRSVYTPLFSGVFWDVQDYPLADVDRIEVISGPGATLWGANAVNGVINVETKSAKDTQGLYLEAAGGTEVRDKAVVRYGAALAPNVYARVYGMTTDRDNQVFANGSTAPDSWTMRRGGFRLDADLPNDAALTFQGDLYRGSEYIVTSGIQRVAGGNVLGRWTRTFSPQSDMRLQVYYDRTHLADPVTNQFGTDEYLVDDLDTYDVDFQHRFPLNWRQQVVWGAGYRLTHDSVQNAANTAFLPAQVDHQLFSAFAQDEIAVGKEMFATIGTKLEHDDYTGFEVEPAIRLRWRIAHTQSIWAAVSRAVRMPSRYDRDIFEPRPPPVVATGDKSFRSETLTAYELGYRAQLTHRVSTSLSIFYNDYADLRSFGYAPGMTRQFTFGNNLEGETHGLEWSLQDQITDRWNVRAGYDLLLENIHPKPGQIDLYNGLNEISDPEHHGSLDSAWSLPHHLMLDTNLRWVGRRPTAHGVVPGYADLDARLAWQVSDSARLSIVGQNLLHAHHPEFGIDIPRREEVQRGVYADLSLSY